MLKISESQVKKQIKQWLKLKGIFFWSQDTAGVPDGRGGFRPPAMRGVSDILAIHPRTGQLIAIECKSSIGKTSPFQNFFLKKVKDNHAIAVVAKGVEDVEQAIGCIDRHNIAFSNGTCGCVEEKT